MALSRWSIDRQMRCAVVWSMQPAAGAVEHAASAMPMARAGGSAPASTMTRRTRTLWPAMIPVMAVFWRPRSALRALAEHPSLATGLASVLATGVLALGLQVAAAAVSGNAGDGLAISLALPLLFVPYWAIATSLIDAGARILGRAGRRRAFLAVSGAAFPALLAYAL